MTSQVFHSKSLYEIVLMVLPDWLVINVGEDTFRSRVCITRVNLS